MIMAVWNRCGPCCQFYHNLSWSYWIHLQIIWRNKENETDEDEKMDFEEMFDEDLDIEFVFNPDFALITKYDSRYILVA